MLKLKLNIDCYAILHLSMYMYVSDMTDNLDHNLNQLTCRCLHGNVLVHVRLPVVLKINSGIKFLCNLYVLGRP